MIQTTLVAVGAAASFFGLIFLVQNRVPDTADESSYEDIKQASATTPPAKAQALGTLPKPEPKLAPKTAALPPQILGDFTLDLEATKGWLKLQPNIPQNIMEQLVNIYKPKSISFDGTTWTTNIGNITYSETPEIIQNEETIVKLMLKTNQDAQPSPYFIQWVKDGFWLSHYAQVQPTNKNILLREFYSQKKP